MKLKSVKKIISFIISVLLIVPAISSTVFAADTDVTESSTYVLDRDSNGDFMFQYQSPCSFSYDLENWEKSWSTVNVYTMYDQLSGDHFPAYCCDITTTANKGANYRRMNIEDSPFAGTEGPGRGAPYRFFFPYPCSCQQDPGYRFDGHDALFH